MYRIDIGGYGIEDYLFIFLKKSHRALVFSFSFSGPFDSITVKNSLRAVDVFNESILKRR